jgi:chemotaxis protein MotB
MSGGRGRRARHEDEAGHGGQWKVAYADFVTAMMAFFLIMWLVSSATETERAVIAK